MKRGFGLRIVQGIYKGDLVRERFEVFKVGWQVKMNLLEPWEFYLEEGSLCVKRFCLWWHGWLT